MLFISQNSVEGGNDIPGCSSLGGTPSRGLGTFRISLFSPDLEKRKNPVCHFVTPLDGSVDVDEHRRPEVFKQHVVEWG